MQIIQSIRDKGAAIVIVVIALSLIGFILMDAQQGSSNMFSSLSNQVGSVNGQAIELGEFNKRIQQTEEAQAAQTGQRPSGVQMYQMRDQLWNQVVAEKIFFAEAEKLGIAFTAKELSAVLLSNDPSNPLLQERSLLDSVTGKLDMTKAQATLTNIKKSKGAQRDVVNAQIVDPMRLSNTVAKYTGMLNASVYYPTWMKEKDKAESANFASITYVSVPYTDILDSTIKVTDAEINEYVSKHKDMFKQDAGRYISYITFSSLASGEDSTRILNELNALRDPFAADTNSRLFVSRNASVMDYSDNYEPKSRISTAVADTLTSLPMGAVYGPYADKGNFVLAKMLGSKSQPDSVRASHILLGFSNPQTGQPLYDEATAKKKADSIYNAIKAGSPFPILAAMFSSDGSKDKGGDLGTFGFGAMVPEFNAYCFDNPVGSLGVVRTQFGYHVIQVTEQKDFKNAYKIAYLAREINASDATISKASLEATKASAEKKKESLEKYAAKNGLRLTEVPTLLKENDFNVGALQDARQIVRWAFEAKVGDVSEPMVVGDEYIVATLNKVAAKGTQDAATARSGCEAIIRNKKKAAQIMEKIGKNPTLESAAAAYTKTVMQAGADSSITMSAQFVNSIGVEPKLIGAAFNKANQGKVSAPIEGSSAVYLIRTDAYGTKNPETPEVEQQQMTTRKNNMRSQINGWYESLRKLADIEDQRSKYF